MNRTALRQRDVRLIVGAVGISAVGDVLLWVPLTLHLRAMTDSGLAVAALMLCLWAPIVLLAPVAGLLADRLEARRLLIVASLAQAAVAGALALVPVIARGLRMGCGADARAGAPRGAPDRSGGIRRGRADASPGSATSIPRAADARVPRARGVRRCAARRTTAARCETLAGGL